MKPVAMVLSGFPRWSETFALPELVALDERGLLGPLFATKKGDQSAIQPAAEPFLDRVEFLPEAGVRAQADWLAHRLSVQPVSGIHGYFSHRPAEVAQIAARACGVPFGFSAHAKDARKVPPSVLAARARAACCVVGCNRDVVGELEALGSAVTQLPHGVDTSRFRATRPRPGSVLQLLSVGRLVEKKGFSSLLAACARLEFPFKLRIVGQGEQQLRLAEEIRGWGLEDRVELAGLRTHDALPAEYERCDVVVVPSIVDAAGDKDGLPNVVLEAMASGRPVVGTRIADLDSAVCDGQTGLLVEPDQPDRLAAAIRRLALDKELRAQFGQKARQCVESRFDADRCAAAFSDHLEKAYGSAS